MSQVTRDEVGFLDVATYNAYIGGTLIPQAEAFIDNHCGGRSGTLRRFNMNYGSLNLDGIGKGVIFLPPKYAPWYHLGTVKVNGVAATTSNIKIHDQFLDYDGGRFTEGHRNIMVIGSHGYTTVPDDVGYVCGQLCANILLDMKRRRRGDVGVSTGGVGIGGVLGNPALLSSPWVFTKELRALLDPYIIRWVDIG